jgi:hypothetical protein
MLGLLKGAFRVLAEVLFWFIPIVCAIIGGVFSGRNGFLGVLIGFVVGILVDIIYGGAIATLLVIEETTSKMEKDIDKIVAFLKKSANAAKTANAVDNFEVRPITGATQYKTMASKIEASNDDTTFECG